MSKSILIEWYSDEGFPEIKTSSADAVAVVKDPKQLYRVIEEHNALVNDLQHALRYLRAGKARFAPHTTNSDVDMLLAKYD